MMKKNNFLLYGDNSVMLIFGCANGWSFENRITTVFAAMLSDSKFLNHDRIHEKLLMMKKSVW